MNVNSTSNSGSTYTSNRRMSGLISGLDTDALVKNLTMATQNKIDKQKQKGQIIAWQQEMYRSIISDMTSFQTKYFSFTNSSTNIMSSSFFNTSSIKSSSDLIKASGDKNAIQGMRISQVSKLASQARLNSSHKVSGSDPKIGTGFLQETYRENDIAGAKLVMEVDGVKYTGQLSSDIDLPTVGQNFRAGDGSIRAATEQDVQDIMQKELNKALKNMSYKDPVTEKTYTGEDISDKVKFSYNSVDNKFSIQSADGDSHKVKLVDYTSVTADGKTVTTGETSQKLLGGIGMKTDNTEKVVDSANSLIASSTGVIKNYYDKTIPAGSYIDVKFKDGTTHRLTISSNVDMDVSGEIDPSKAFQERLEAVMNRAILEEGLEDDITFKASESGFTMTANGQAGKKDQMVVTGGSSNLLDAFNLKTEAEGATMGKTTTGTNTALDENLYTRHLGDQLTGTTLTLKLNGMAKEITFEESESSQYDTAAELAQYLQDKVATAFGDVTYISGGSTQVVTGSPKVLVNYNAVTGGLDFQTQEVKKNSNGDFIDAGGNVVTDPADALSTNNLSTIEITSSDNSNVLGSTGALRVNALSSNRVTTNDSLKNIGDKLGFSQLLDKNGNPSGKYGLNVNGKNFVFDEDTTLALALTTINSDKSVGLTLQYSSTNDALNVVAKDYGAQEQIDIKEYQNSGPDDFQVDTTPGKKGFAESLFGTASEYTFVQGEDSQMDVSFDDGATWQTVSRTSNNFSLNGVSFELTNLVNADKSVVDARAAAVTFKVETDSDALYDKLKTFVEDYNKIVEALYSKTHESKPKDSSGNFTSFKPLTDAQKADMSEDEIKQWNEKAKQGILNNDEDLKRVSADMRSAVNSIVNSSGFKALSKIGIATDSYDWESGGKLVINDEVLKAAIKEDPDSIAEVFTNKTDGVAAKLKEVLDKNVGTFGGDGILIARAGKASRETDQSVMGEKITSVNKQIEKLVKQLKAEQERYYRQFTNMEKLLSNISSQSSWLTQNMGG